MQFFFYNPVWASFRVPQLIRITVSTLVSAEHSNPLTSMPPNGY